MLYLAISHGPLSHVSLAGLLLGKMEKPGDGILE